MTELDVVIIGAGPGGLAVGGALREREIPCRILDRAATVGSSWRGHYDRLHLHTARHFSALPGYAIPKAMGRWVSRGDLVTYLEDYARHHELDIRFNTEVKRLDRDGDRWRLVTAGGPLRARAVVVATGYNHSPALPDWPGMNRFKGEIVHSTGYRNAEEYRAKDVLVVGVGNSGAEIAVDLVEGGAGRVLISIRTPPNIQRREFLGLPTQVLGILIKPLPVPVVDRMTLVMQRLAIGDLSDYGVPAPRRGVYSAILDGHIPLIDVGLLELLKQRRVEAVPAVEGFAPGSVLLAGGRRVKVDAVVAATGFQRGLDSMVGDLGVLLPNGRPAFHGARTSPAAPNLHFIGYTNPINGNLLEMNKDARRIARVLA